MEYANLPINRQRPTQLDTLQLFQAAEWCEILHFGVFERNKGEILCMLNALEVLYFLPRLCAIADAEVERITIKFITPHFFIMRLYITRQMICWPMLAAP